MIYCERDNFQINNCGLCYANLEQYIFSKSATSYCTSKHLYSVYSFVYVHFVLIIQFPSPLVCCLPFCYQAKEIGFAAHVKNMWVVTSSKLCQLYLLHWRRNN